VGGGDQSDDLGADVVDPGIQGSDVGEVVAGDLHPDLTDVLDGANPTGQRLGLVRRQLAAHPPG
jgi:hypothetical protein